MSRKKKIIFAVIALLLGGLLFAAFILPLIVRSQLELQTAKATGRSCRVSKVSINPLDLSVKVRGVSLAEKDNKGVFVSFSSLSFRVSPASVYRLAPVVVNLELKSPYLHIVRTAPNRYNFTDILERQPEKKSSSPARFSLNNIVIKKGRAEFEDLAASKPTRHTLSGLEMSLPFISNISYFADRYVDPSLSVLVNGTPVRFDGKLKPFAKGMESQVRLNLNGLNIPYYAAYFPTSLPVKVNRGKLSTDLEINHRLVRGGKPDIDIHGRVNLQNIALSAKSGEPLLGLESLALNIAKAGLLTDSFDITSLVLSGPELFVSRDHGGVWNFDRLKSPKESATGPKSEAKGETKAKITLGTLAITGGKVHLKDGLPKAGFNADLQDVALKVDNFTSWGEIPATYLLSFATARGEKGEVRGNFISDPLQISSRINLNGLVMEAPYPYLADILTSPVKGRADLSGDLAYADGPGLTMDRLMLRLKGVVVPFGEPDSLQLQLLSAEGGSLSLKERKFALERLTLSGGKTGISRAPDGKLSPELLLRPAAVSSKPAKKESPPPFRWRIGSVAVNGFDATFVDRTKEENPKFTFSKIRATASAITGPSMGEMPFSFSSAYAGQGEITGTGRLLPSPLKLKGEFRAKRVPLLDFEPYLPEGVNVLLLDGKLDAHITVDLITRQDKTLAGSFRGESGIREFYSVDAESEEDLLKWENLQLDGISGSLSPFSLVMTGATLNNYYARVIINKEGRINLQDLYTPPSGQPAPGVPSAVSLPQRKDVAATGAPKTVRIDSITLQDGILNFTDQHLNRDFATTMLNLGGRVTGLSSDSGAMADIDLRGNLENHSPLKIIGKINPLRGDLFLDMAINFSEIELSPMTPYSGTYLGYAIDKGKLSLALKYKVDQKKLSAENSIFLDQFTFGEKIESKKATSLPVKLAVALLKDRSGEIHLDLPLSGRTDDPKFSIWGVVGQMLKNLLLKAATSPFALLQSAFGSAGDFSSITFAPGSSRLSATEEAKLKNLAKALTERPGLKLEITGFADRERDPEGYRQQLLLKKMKNEKFLAVVKEKRESSGLSAETMEIAPDETSRWLKSVYEKEKFPRPRTVVGTLKSLPDEEMRKLILANTMVNEQQLRQLARERSIAVTSFLVKEGRLPQERLFEKSGDPFAQPAKQGGPASRVEFGVSD